MDFPGFFRLAAGHDPYPYQLRVAEEGLPDVLEVPTGAGKTLAVVVGWMYRRFRHPDPAVRLATPRRLVYAAPMRVLVESITDEIVKARDNLGLKDELPILQLMGGSLSSEDIGSWRVSMDSESIVVGTVDQIVSRQLMRGYGAGRGTYPMDFALVTNGAHVVVDEIQLCGQATSTARQVAAFQRRAGWETAEPVGLTCLSATIEPAYLDTVDNPFDGQTVQLGEGDRSASLSKRLDATRRVTRVTGDTKPRSIAALAAEAHKAGTLTLVVVNRVKDAVELHAAVAKLLAKKENAPELLLVHSRFRGVERAELNGKLRGLTGAEGLKALSRGSGAIVVATQAVEAGIDLDSATLITEAAPWPSLCQRAGRCNRAGEFGAGEETRATLHWFSTGKAEPYDKAQIAASVAALSDLEGRAVTSTDLLSADVDTTPDALSILRGPTFLQLFDTGQDLSGHDIDVSRYIRSDDERDVQVAWIEPVAADVGRVDPVLARPSTRWRVTVPITALRELIARDDRPRAWIYDTFSERWVRVNSRTTLQPQALVLIDRKDGGYDETVGFLPSSRTAVRRIEERCPTCGKVTAESSNDPAAEQPVVDGDADDAAADPLTFTGSWELLEDHLAQCARDTQRLCDSLKLEDHGGDAALAPAVVAAAAVHDIGKSFPGWQAGLRALGTDATGAYVDIPAPPEGLLAKAPGTTTVSICSCRIDDTASMQRPWTRRRLVVRANPTYESGRELAPVYRRREKALRRPAFRHELISLLLLRTREGRDLLDRLGVTPAHRPLVEYLVAAHHGVLRLTPRDPVADGRSGETFLGVVDREWVPGTDCGELRLPGTRADLSIFSGGPGSWSEQTAGLLQRYGPFRLAYLETIMRAGDWRASGARPAGRSAHDEGSET